MTATKKTQAEIENLNAEATYFGEEAESLRLDNMSKAMDLRDDARDHQFKDTADFYHAHLVWTDEVNESTVEVWKQQLRRMARFGHKDILVELNTPGGSIVDGFALFDEIVRIRKSGVHVTIRVLGQAASMGAVILQAADKREIGENSLVMIHRAAFGAIGKAYEIEDELEFVKKLESQISGIFAKRSGRPVSDFVIFFDKRKDCWFTADEALLAGLVDEVI